MNAEIKKQWVEALRSGKYKQCQRTLRREHIRDGSSECAFGVGFCCLGVLCDLHASLFGGDWKEPDDDGDCRYHDELGELPESVKTWSEFNDARQEHELISLNDDAGKDFDRIADYIEKNL